MENWEKLRNVSSVVVKWTLMFYVAYSALMGEVVLALKYYFIVAIMFTILCSHILICMKCRHIKLSFKKNEYSIFGYIKWIDYVVLFFLAANGIWILLVPYFNFGISLAIDETALLMVFIMYFPLALLIRMGELDFHFIIKVLFGTTFVLACWYITAWCLETLIPGTYQSFFDFLRRIPFLKVGNVYKGWSLVRIVLTNCILLLPPLLLVVAKKEKFRLYDYFFVFVFTFAILCTYLKSLWYGLIFAMLILLIYFYATIVKKKANFNIVKALAVIIATVLVMNFTIFNGTICARLSSSFAHGTTTNTEPDNIIEMDAVCSNDAKITQVIRLLQQWSEKPLMGYGYGSYIPDYFRSETYIYSYEMTAFALLMKIGLIGIAVWLTLLISAAVNAIKKYRKDIPVLILWFTMVIGYLVTIQTNPLLFTSSSLNLIMYFVLATISCKKANGENCLNYQLCSGDSKIKINP